MRIDTTLPSSILGFPTPSGRLGQTASFDTFYTPAPADDKASQAKPAPRQVSSFDAPGMLGLGGTVTGDLAAKRPATDETAAPAGRAAHSLPAVHPVPDLLAVTPPPAEADAASLPAASVAMATAQLVVPADASSSTPLRASVQAALPAEPALSLVSAGSVAAEAGPPIYPGARGSIAEAPEEPAAPQKASPLPKVQSEADPAASHVSVMVSETDGVLHIAAAAPGLSEDDRQTLKSLTDDVAGEAGLVVGELRLNGVPLRSSSKVS